MTVGQFIQLVSDALFLFVFLIVVAGAIRRPHRAQLQSTLFFGAAAYVVLASLIFNHFDKTTPAFITATIQIVLISMSYLLLRLVDSLSDVPLIVLRIGEAGLAVLAVQALAGFGSARYVFVLPAVLYFVVFTVYATLLAIAGSRRVEGVTKQRLRAVATGSTFLGLVIVLAGMGAFVPSIVGNGTHITGEVLGLLCGLSYFVAFATPTIFRRAWLEPVLRRFLSTAVGLPQMPDQRRMLEKLEESARDSLGGVAASLALWNDDSGELLYPTASIGIERALPAKTIEGAAFLSQQATFSDNLSRDFPVSVQLYGHLNISSVMSAPVTSGDHRHGVLSVYLSGSPIFVEDDLTLLSLMANQAGVVLESRGLAEEETRLRAREEALKLRNDFLASITHDLKTPLTALVMQTQILERRARKSPGQPPDPDGLHQIIVQTHRLRSFIEDLLDVQRVGEEGFVLIFESCDLVSLVKEIGQRVCVEPHTFVLDAALDVDLTGDRARLTQLFDNLIGNAVKYSPNGGGVLARLWRDGDVIHATVKDHGIGISKEDLPHVFERHHRGENAIEQGVHGIGLGLFICRTIVQAHGGTLQVESTPGSGSTFHVVIPRSPSTAQAPRATPWPVSAGIPPATADPGELPVNRIALGSSGTS